MNGRPRKTLDWKILDAVMTKEISTFYKNGAFDS